MRADLLEERLIRGLRPIIADPAEIVSAYNQLNAQAQQPDAAALEQAQQRVAAAEQQVRRLARLARFADDEEAADALAEELKEAVKAKRAAERMVERLHEQHRPLPRITPTPRHWPN